MPKAKGAGPRCCHGLSRWAAALPLVVACLTLPAAAWGVGAAPWQQAMTELRWIAYSPSTGNPKTQVEPEASAVRGDLAMLRLPGFDGLVTYASTGVAGEVLPGLACELGFRGLILGVWDPNNTKELEAAAAAAGPLVRGYCVGNEGLDKSYTRQELETAIADLRKRTGKPVTTAEEIDDYDDATLLELGDWVFPNAHPYFHDRLDPEPAVEWTVEAYKRLAARTDRFVLFKEVGLPTAGDAAGVLSSDAQAQYYRRLATTPVRFVYFEGFDLAWKDHLPVEPHWGLFTSERAPKALALALIPGAGTACKQAAVEPQAAKTAAVTNPTGKAAPTSEPPSAGSARKPFPVYTDADSPDNHFTPSGYMGDCGDVRIDEVCETKPHAGRTCIKIDYTPKGNGPHECNYGPPCKWSGVYWQQPPNNFGVDETHKDAGYDLEGYTRLVFHARGETPCRMEFKVGGISGPYGDSQKKPVDKLVDLTTEWQAFAIDLKAADLSYVIGGFCWVAKAVQHPKGAIVYLDDIRFE